MFGIGGPELIVILVVALIALGPQRLPEIARALGKAYREFERSLDDVRQNLEELGREEPEKHEGEGEKSPPAAKGPGPDDIR
jgi:sec-independent protein translocase protein TatA